MGDGQHLGLVLSLYLISLNLLLTDLGLFHILFATLKNDDKFFEVRRPQAKKHH